MPISLEFTTGIAIGLLLPAVQQARHAARRSSSMNNCRQLGLALHNYEAVHNRFPPAHSVDENGKPLLSWRVHILPYLEQQALYEQFKLDEPWDSPHNIKLVDQMPMLFRCPAQALTDGHTTYMAVVGPGSILNQEPMADGKPGVRFSEITDGSSNTILLVQTNTELEVPWTAPQDFEYEKSEDLLGDLTGTWIGNLVLATIADGSVQMIQLDAENPKKILGGFHRNDGKPWSEANGFE